MTDGNPPGGVSRRRLLKGAAAAATVIAAPGCSDEDGALPAADVDAPEFEPVPPARPLVCRVYSFFDADQAATVEAIGARLIPGDESDPGAREACVVTYIDQKLARFEGFAEPTYTEGPSATALGVSEDQLPRYGFQSSLTPQDAYRNGLRALDRYCRRRFDDRFVALGDARQDRVLEALEADKAEGFSDPSAKDFFALVQEDVVEGMFADPIYGGNAALAGWKLIGYPGAQRAYTPREMRRGTRRRPQGLRDMSPMHPGHPDEDAILPISGSRQRG